MNSETENRPHTEFQQKVIERSRRGITPAVAAVVSVVVVLIIVGFGYLAVSTNWFTTGINQGNLTNHTVTYSTTATYTPPASGQASFQNLGLAAGCQNSFIASTVVTTSTGCNVNWWVPVGSTYASAGAISATSTALVQTNSGLIYIQGQVGSGNSYYVDPYATAQHNPGWSQAFQWANLGGGSTKYFNWNYNLANLKINANQNPTLAFNLYMMPTATPTAVACACNQTGLGTSQVSVNVSPVVTVPSGTQGVAVEITQIVDVFNISSNAGGIIQSGTWTIPTTYSNTGPISSTVATLPIGSSGCYVSGTTYTCTINIASSTTDFSTGQYLMYNINGVSTFTFGHGLTLNLGAAGAPASQLKETVTIYYLTGAGAATAMSSEVIGYHV